MRPDQRLDSQMCPFMASQTGLQLKDLFLVMIQLPTILLDINKVIDSVPHDLLLEQIWKCGLTGSLWWLFHSYLSDCRQCVRVEGQLSGWLPVCSGVLQGSILGLLLFIIHAYQ